MKDVCLCKTTWRLKEFRFRLKLLPTISLSIRRFNIETSLDRNALESVCQNRMYTKVLLKATWCGWPRWIHGAGTVYGYWPSLHIQQRRWRVYGLFNMSPWSPRATRWTAAIPSADKPEKIHYRRMEQHLHMLSCVSRGNSRFFSRIETGSRIIVFFSSVRTKRVSTSLGRPTCQNRRSSRLPRAKEAANTSPHECVSSSFEDPIPERLFLRVRLCCVFWRQITSVEEARKLGIEQWMSSGAFNELPSSTFTRSSLAYEQKQWSSYATTEQTNAVQNTRDIPAFATNKHFSKETSMNLIAFCTNNFKFCFNI